jgi:hypothetical protein
VSHFDLQYIKSITHPPTHRCQINKAELANSYNIKPKLVFDYHEQGTRLIHLASGGNPPQNVLMYLFLLHDIGSLYIIFLVAFLRMKTRIIYRKNLTTEGADWMAKLLRNPGSKSIPAEHSVPC